MKFHKNEDLFKQAVRAAADHFATRDVFIEKDYWVTYALKNLFTSDLAEISVFKGGTSLSKAYRIIDRFSEDVDLALIPWQGRSGAGTKKLLRRLTSTAGLGLTEDKATADQEKHSNIRKVYYVYPRMVEGILPGQVGDRLLIEANAFSRPQPSRHIKIQSYLSEFLADIKEDSLVKNNELGSFPVNVLTPEKTLAEKVIALIKASFIKDPTDILRQKIRHIYDVHQLLQLDGMRKFCFSETFFAHLQATLEDDRLSPIGNKDWMEQSIKNCMIFQNPGQIWPQLSPIYNTNFRDMMFGPLPSGELILDTLGFLGSVLNAFEE